MAREYAGDSDELDGEVAVPQGQSIAGHAIGVIVIETWYPLLPGNVANASTFQFPVLYKVLHGVSVAQILAGDSTLEDKVIEGAGELARQGARAVVGACGTFGNYQKAVADSVEVPVFMSVLMQVPMIQHSLKPGEKVGIVAASAGSVTPALMEQCGIDEPDRLVVVGADSLPEFQNILNCTGRFNNDRMRREVVDLARGMVEEDRDIAAVLLQCSDLPPYAHAVQQAVHLPVFDMTTLMEWLYRAVARKPFQGFI